MNLSSHLFTHLTVYDGLSEHIIESCRCSRFEWDLDPYVHWHGALIIKPLTKLGNSALLLPI